MTQLRIHLSRSSDVAKAAQAAHEAMIAAEAERKEAIEAAVEAGEPVPDRAPVTVLSPRHIVGLIMASEEFKALVQEKLADPVAFGREHG